MTTFVLVHGAWHQGSSWERVQPELERHGHTVHAPSLRSDPAARLRDHVDQLVGTITATVALAGEPVTVVAHSYAGVPAAQAATRANGSVERLVLIDGWMAPAGKSMIDVAPDWFGNWCRAVADGDPAILPVPPLSSVGLREDGPDAAWLAPRLVDHPLATFTDPVEIDLVTTNLELHAVLCLPTVMPFREIATAAGAYLHEIESGHDVMVSRPVDLGTLLHQIVS